MFCIARCNASYCMENPQIIPKISEGKPLENKYR
jgi:hypothetical protein